MINMNFRSFIKLFIYGLVQWFALLLCIFLISLIVGVKEGAEMSAPPPFGLLGVAVIMVAVSYFIARRLKFSSQKQALYAGLVWSGLTIAFMLATVFMNDTQDVILGSWGIYFVFIAQLVGALLASGNKANSNNPLPTNQ